MVNREGTNDTIEANEKEEQVNAILFDIEIENAIQGRNEQRIPGIRYCNGWDDYKGAGIAVIGVYCYADGSTHVYAKDNIDEFVKLATSADLCIGYNNLRFDNAVIRACLGLDLDNKTYDLLREIWVAAGLAPEFSYPSHVGYGLADVSQSNGGPPKTGHGAMAPVLFQQGKIGQLIDYCLADIWLTRRLVDQVRRGVPIACPKTGQLLNVRKPF